MRMLKKTKLEEISFPLSRRKNFQVCLTAACCPSKGFYDLPPPFRPLLKVEISNQIEQFDIVKVAVDTSYEPATV